MNFAQSLESIQNFLFFPQVLNEGKYELNTSEARSHLFEVQKEAYKTQLNHNVPISQNRYSLPHLKLNSCYADNPSAIGISPDGKLYKCAENIAFTPSFGNIFESQKIDESKINCFTKKHDWKKCHDCVFYPSCLNLSMCSARQKECQPCHFDFKLWKTKSCMKDEWDKYQLSLKC